MLICGAKTFGKHTETAGTVITELIPPRAGLKAGLQHLQYEPNGTEHTLTCMKPYSRTTASAAAEASQAVINLTADPGTGTTPGAIAANDWLVIEHTDGTWGLYKVSSVATLAITLTENLSKAVDSGATVHFLGAEGNAHPQFELADGAVRTIGDVKADVPVAITDKVGEPLVLHIDNATNAGTLKNAQGVYVQETAAGGYGAL